MSYTPVNGDASSVAGYTITRLNATIPTSGAFTSDQATAIADSYLGSIGFIVQDEQACTAGSTTSTSFVNVTGMPTYIFSAPVAKVYLIHLDVSGHFQSVGLNGLTFQIRNTTTSTNGNSSTWTWSPSAVNIRSSRFSARTPMTMVQGSNTLQVQWKTASGADTVNVDVATSRAFTITG